MDQDLSAQLSPTIAKYTALFTRQVYNEEPFQSDILLEAFHLSPVVIRQHKQYWHRHLGACWERLVKSVFSSHVSYQGTIRLKNKSPCDFTFDKIAVDTKYRLGSGDSGTMGKLSRNAQWLKSMGFEPMMLILREDNLPQAIARMQGAGWAVLCADASFKFIARHGDFDLKAYLDSLKTRIA